MEKELFYAYLKGDKKLDDDAIVQLEQMVKKYPYFQTAKLMLLKCRKDSDHPEFLSDLRNVAVTCSDREKLFYYLNNDKYSRFFPNVDLKDKSDGDRTTKLLDSFLQSIDKNADEKDKTNEINSLDSDSIVSSDYLAYLEHTQTKEKQTDDVDGVKPMKHQQLVDRFLEKSSDGEVLFSNKKREREKEQEPSQVVDNLLDDDTFLTETLAQVYIKQKKYEQALTIIKRLSLNFPKKSIYFADQIRFLEYLILNEKNKK